MEEHTNRTNPMSRGCNVNYTDTQTSDGRRGALTALLQDHEALFPTQLCAHFPHIVDRICTLWKEPAQANAYFQELLTTQRENRIGFPPEVHAEIFALRSFYDNTHPSIVKKDDFWSGVADTY